MPVLVKAAAGGGGRGMRIVRDESELADAIESASREAASAFGDGTVFVEPYLERGRHIEVQIMGDAHGNVVHFHERECSIQRRNQKVLEEAPSPGITDELRTKLHAGALALARHVGYQNAGTVEFLVGDDGTITFLEVNTRLQVEHRVTEAICGFDLVELQLRIAAGEPLPMTQDDVEVVRPRDPGATRRRGPGRAGCRRSARSAVRGVPLGTRRRRRSGTGQRRLAQLRLAPRERGRAPHPIGGRGRGSRASLSDPGSPACRTNAATLIAILTEPDFLAGNTTTAYLDEHPEVLRRACRRRTS
jgi:propionyl-CoA carboxylase alpha chain